MATKQKNKLRDLIISSIEMSKRSGVPVLFMSGPGYGKTTSINAYAEANGYHVETLIGSRFSPEEILGYMVNDGGDSLSVKQPEWYGRIIAYEKGMAPDCVGAVVDKDGNVTKPGKPKHSILFLDEISTAPDAVQGSLLSLVFDRKIGNGKPLPKDCIVLSAANYKPNLPAMMNIMAPTLNRFCIVNLISKDIKPVDLIKEFTQDTNNIMNDLPKFEDNELDEETIKATYKTMENFYTTLAQQYATQSASKGYINFANADVADIYDTDGAVYGFISGRTMSYSIRVLQAILEMGLDAESYITKSFILGLIGLGTNSFTNAKQIEDYQKTVTSYYAKVINTIKTHKTLNNAPVLDYSNDDICNAIKRWEQYAESNNFTVDNNLINLFNKIVRKVMDDRKDLAAYLSDLKKDQTKYATFVAEKEAISRLISTVESIKDSCAQTDVMNNVISQLQQIHQNYVTIESSNGDL